MDMCAHVHLQAHIEAELQVNMHKLNQPACLLCLSFQS